MTEAEKIRFLKAFNAPRPKDNSQPDKMRVLIADDEMEIRNILGILMNKMGFEAVFASNGRFALELFCREHFDLVLTDFNMPEMDGFVLTRHIKTQSVSTPVVLFTGSTDANIQELVKRSGVDRLVLKPFQLAEVRKHIEQLMRAGRKKMPLEA